MDVGFSCSPSTGRISPTIAIVSLPSTIPVSKLLGQSGNSTALCHVRLMDPGVLVGTAVGAMLILSVVVCFILNGCALGQGYVVSPS